MFISIITVASQKFLNLKQSTMKKLFAILAVAGFLAACNGGESKVEATVDSAAAKVDSAASAMVDSAAVKADSAKVDSAKAVVDTVKAAVKK